MFDLQRVIKLLNYAVMLVLKRLQRFYKGCIKVFVSLRKERHIKKKRLSLCDGLYRGETEWARLAIKTMSEHLRQRRLI